MPDRAARNSWTSCVRAAVGAALGLLLLAVPAHATGREALPLPPPPSRAAPISLPVAVSAESALSAASAESAVSALSALSAVSAVSALSAVRALSAVSAARPCPGAHRRSGGRARRVAVACLVNRARRRAGRRGLMWNRALGRAAARQARDMARRGYFAHRRAGGPSPAKRARVAGFRGRGVGEAIAYGCGSSSTPLAIVGMWLASPMHRAILLSRRRRVGIGVAGRPPVACGGRGATYALDAG